MKVSNRMAAAGLLVGLFLAGGVAGGAIVHVVTSGDGPGPDLPGWEGRRGRAESDSRRRGGPGEPRSFTTGRVLDRLETRLDLTAGQRDSIEAILERQRSAAGEIFREMGPELRATVDSANARIRDVLDEEQRARFEELLRRDRGVLGRPAPPDSGDGG